MNIELKRKNWVTWLDLIEEDVKRVLSRRLLYREYVKIVEANPKIQQPRYFHDWVAINYGTYVTTAIRRQIDNDRRTRSFKRFLGDIKANPQVITKQWHRTLYNNLGAAYADEQFGKLAGGGKYFDRVIAQNDLNKLDVLGKDIKKWVDENVAHSSSSPAASVPTTQDMDTFLDEFEKMVIKYKLLLTGSEWAALEPVMGFDWQEIFYIPWIEKS